MLMGFWGTSIVTLPEVRRIFAGNHSDAAWVGPSFPSKPWHSDCTIDPSGPLVAATKRTPSVAQPRPNPLKNVARRSRRRSILDGILRRRERALLLQAIDRIEGFRNNCACGGPVTHPWSDTVGGGRIRDGLRRSHGRNAVHDRIVNRGNLSGGCAARCSESDGPCFQENRLRSRYSNRPHWVLCSHHRVTACMADFAYAR